MDRIISSKQEDDSPLVHIIVQVNDGTQYHADITPPEFELRMYAQRFLSFDRNDPRGKVILESEVEELIKLARAAESSDNLLDSLGSEEVR